MNLLAPRQPVAEVAPTGCIGDGTSGKRVQLMYVRQQGQASRMAEVVPMMQQWAVDIDEYFLRSAQLEGGFRRVRWVTDGTCAPTVLEHVVPDGVTDFTAITDSLAAQGKRPANRKLIFAADSESWCGYGEKLSDDRPGPENTNNTQDQAAVGGVGVVCWGPTSVAHELGHILGAVQESAPNSTGSHCSDEFDLMCYFDGTGVPMREVCPRIHDMMFDCNHDDYFALHPAAGSYLDTHWNIARSDFLDSSAWFLPPQRPETPLAVAGASGVRVTWQPPLFDGATPVTSYVVTVHPTEERIKVGNRLSTRVAIPAGEPVSFTVRARNAAGLGVESISTEVVTPTPPITALASLRRWHPTSVAEGPGGATWVGAREGLLRVTPDGQVTRVSKAGAASNDLPEGSRLGRTALRPVDLETQPGSGDLYLVDALSGRVRRLHGGRVRSVTPRWLAASAVGFDERRRLLVVEASKNRLWRQAADRSWSRVAGSASGDPGFAGDDGPAVDALLRNPSGVASDKQGRLYVADRGNHRVRRIARDGTITTFAGNGADTVGAGSIFDGTDSIYLLLPRPEGITFGADRLFVQSGARVVAIRPDRLHVTYLGHPGQPGSSGDGGPAHRARISDDVDLAMDGARLLVLDRAADRLRRVARLGPAVPAK